jgi:hypothetical protein
MEAHLGSCARCSAELGDLRTVIRAVRAIAPDAVPEDLIPRLRQAVRERAPAPVGLFRTWPRIAIPVGLAAALVAASFALRTPRRASLIRAAARPITGKGAIAERGLGAGPIERQATQRIAVAEAPKPAAGAPQETEPTEVKGALKMAQGSAAAADQALARGRTAEAVPGPPGPPAAVAEQYLPPPAAPSLGAGMGGGGRGGGGARRGPTAGAPPPVRTVGGLGRSDEFRQHEDFARPSGERETVCEAAAVCAPALEEPPPPPFSVKAVLVEDKGHPAIALQLGGDEAAQEITVRVGKQGERQLAWQGAASTAPAIVLSAEEVGSAPAAIPVSLSSPTGRACPSRPRHITAIRSLTPSSSGK